MPLQWGSSNQSVSVVVDTGSSWLWAYSDSCKIEDASVTECQSTKSYYHKASSTSFRSLGEAKKTVYGSLELNGITATEDVTFGGRLTAAGMQILYEDINNVK